MKAVLLSILMSSSTVFATDYSACDGKTDNCAKPKSCSTFYLCLDQEYQLLNILILKAINELEFNQKQMCVDKRDSLEVKIQAHATTIECMDTVNGPQFGG